MTRHARGFTLLEMSVVLLLLGLMTSAALPTLNSVTGANLRTSASRVQGLLREAYTRAALSGLTCRVVFDTQERTVWVEETQEKARLGRTARTVDRDGTAALDVIDERIVNIDTENIERLDAKDKEKLRLFAPPTWQPSEVIEKLELTDDVYFRAVWAEHLDRPISQGKAAIVFFPGGYSEDAFVTLSDEPPDSTDSPATISIVVNPLTGETSSTDEEPLVSSFR